MLPRALKAFALVATVTFLFGAYDVAAQWQRGIGEQLLSDVCSDYIWRFRIAVTPKSKIAYAFLGATSQLAAFAYSQTDRGVLPPTFVTEPIPLANVTQPVLNVDTSTDRVYFIHPVDGKIYCYDASLNTTAPVWVSDTVCTDPTDERAQARQTFTANGTRLLARCNDSILVLDERGRAVKSFVGDAVAAFVRNADAAAPIAMHAGFTRFVTWAAVAVNEDGSSDAPPPSKLSVWDLSVKAKRVSKPAAVIPMPDGASPAGASSDSPWLVAVPDAASPVLHLFSTANGKWQTSFDFGPLVNANGSLTGVLVVPTPAIANRTVYGIVQGVLPSPYPWVPGYPDKYFYWVFALNVSEPRRPSLQWITSEIVTRGAVANQVPLVRGPAVFMTDYLQNATRSFWRATGSTYFNVPGNPYSSATSTTYSIIKGTYKMSLPYVDPTGVYLMFQYDDWVVDALPPADRVGRAVGYIRTMTGLPYAATSLAGSR